MKSRHELEKVFARITDHSEMIAFFEEIFTPKEIKDLTLRWQLLKELHEKQPQRSIAAKHGISLCKITRGSKILKKKNSITRKILDSLPEHAAKKQG
ncbi:MAG TPA: transcriptional regulator [Deltaproteobacteria bacterium]|nr:transcriptional regulator [Deltaproteobacteria bacterium]